MNNDNERIAEGYINVLNSHEEALNKVQNVIKQMTSEYIERMINVKPIEGILFKLLKERDKLHISIEDKYSISQELGDIIEQDLTDLKNRYDGTIKTLEHILRTHKKSFQQDPSNEPQHSDNNSNVVEHEQQQAKQDIPLLRGTQQEIDVFGKALQKGYMSLCNGGYKWTKSKRLLAYMCGRLYCGDRIREDDNDDIHYKKGRQQLPAKELKALFNENVGANRDVMTAPPRGHWIIDDLF